MRRAAARRPAVVLAVLATVTLAGCGSGGSGPGGQQAGSLTVLAAASLSEAFGRLEAPFEAAHPGVDLRFDFQGSSTLAQQILAGRQAGVFASANRVQMQRVVVAGLTAGRPQIFATNTLTIAVPTGNPAGIDGLSDLANEQLELVVCIPQVPCGAAAVQAFREAGVTLQPDSEEPDVKSVLSKVQAGEADAGLVYVTDVATADPPVGSIEFSTADAAVNRYPIAVFGEAPHPRLARDFVDLVRAERGRAVLREIGFGVP